MHSSNDALWRLADAISINTNCIKRSVGCVIIDKTTDLVVSTGFNFHENGVCDCYVGSTAVHAEINALANIEHKYPKRNLIALVTRRPCKSCHNALMKQVSEVRYTHES